MCLSELRVNLPFSSEQGVNLFSPLQHRTSVAVVTRNVSICVLRRKGRLNASVRSLEPQSIEKRASVVKVRGSVSVSIPFHSTSELYSIPLLYSIPFHF